MTVAKRAAKTPTAALAKGRAKGASKTASTKVQADKAHPLPHDKLYARILRELRRSPNAAVDLTPLAEELGMDAHALQIEVERLGHRGFVVLPFIEPGAGGGAELTQKGLAWLIAQEGGKPKDVPVALKVARDRVRAEDEAARLPRADVYGAGR